MHLRPSKSASSLSDVGMNQECHIRDEEQNFCVNIDCSGNIAGFIKHRENFQALQRVACSRLLIAI